MPNGSRNVFSVIIAAFVGASASTTSAQQITISAVLVPVEEILIPAQRAGLIAAMKYERGDRISANETIGELHRQEVDLKIAVASAALNQAKAQAANDAPVQILELEAQRAEKEHQLIRELGDDSVYLERFRAANAARRANANLRNAEHDRNQQLLLVDMKTSELALLQFERQQMELRSPVEGVLREVLKHRGEWVERGEPVAAAVRMDRLRIEGFIDVAGQAPHELTGMLAIAKIGVGENRTEVLTGLSVRNVSPKLELDGKLALWVDFENRIVPQRDGSRRWLFRPGMTAELVVDSTELPPLNSHVNTH